MEQKILIYTIFILIGITISTNLISAHGLDQFVDYSNPAYGINFKYPSQWQKIEGTGPEPIVQFRFNTPSGHLIEARVDVVNVTPDTTLENIRAWLVQGDGLPKIIGAAAAYAFGEHGDTRTCQNDESHYMVYAARTGGENKIGQYFAIIKSEMRAYIVTYKVQQTIHLVESGLAPDNFANYYPLYQEITRSLIITHSSGETPKCIIPEPSPPVNVNTPSVNVNKKVNEKVLTKGTIYQNEDEWINHIPTSSTLYNILISCKDTLPASKCSSTPDKIKQIMIRLNDDRFMYADKIIQPNGCANWSCGYWIAEKNGYWTLKFFFNKGSQERMPISIELRESATFNWGGRYDMKFIGTSPTEMKCNDESQTCERTTYGKGRSDINQ